jgi:predicted ribonuclease toxin of YeeF-YezG toxin-antitoxin module
VLSQVAAAATNTTTTTASSNTTTTANNSTKVVRQSSELMISLLSRVSGLTKTQKKALLRVLDTMEEPEQQSDQQLDPQPKATETKGIQIRTKRKTRKVLFVIVVVV